MALTDLTLAATQSETREFQASMHHTHTHTHTHIQVAESKPAKEASSPVNFAIHNVLHIYNNQHKRDGSLHVRQVKFGTCNDDQFTEFFRSYPSTCALGIEAVNISAFVTGEPGAFTEFSNAFCNKECGQPIVDLFSQCGLTEISGVLVYTCKLNEDGDTCGEIFPTVQESGASATNACLPLNATCSTSCLQALDTLRDVGCCANSNQIGINIDGVQIEGYNELYELCGEDIIEPCTEGILNSGNTPVFTTAVWGLTALALTVTILLL